MINSSKPIKIVGWDLDKTIFGSHIHNWLMEEIRLKRTTRENALEHFKTYKLSKELFLNFKEQAKLMLDIGSNGIHQGIVSFTDFPEIVRPALKYLLAEYMMEDLFPESNLANTITEEMRARLNDSSAEQAYKETLEQVQGLVDNIVDDMFVMGGYPTKLGAPTIAAKSADRNKYCGKAQHLMALRKHCSPTQDHSDFAASEVLLIDDDHGNLYKAGQFGYQAILASAHGYHFTLIRKMLNLAVEEEQLDIQKDHIPSTPLNQSLEEVALLNSSGSLELKRKALQCSAEATFLPGYQAMSNSLRKLALSQGNMPFENFGLTHSSPVVSNEPSSFKNRKLCHSH